jgi:hypothetical protein
MSSQAKEIIALFLSVGVGFGIFVSSIAWPVAWYYQSVTVEAMRLGYEQQPVQTGQGFNYVWAKGPAAP